MSEPGSPRVLEELCKTFGRKMKAVRESRGLSVRKVDRISGMGRETIQRLERCTASHRGGVFRGARLDTMLRLAYALEVNLADVLPTHEEIREALESDTRERNGL